MDGQCSWDRERIRNNMEQTLISRVIRELLSREMWSDLFENDQVAAKGRAGGVESDPQEILNPAFKFTPTSLPTALASLGPLHRVHIALTSLQLDLQRPLLF